MKKYFILLICILFSATLTSCHNRNFDQLDKDNIYAQIVIAGYGNVNLKLDHDEAPITVDNFVNLCLKNFYNGTIFHRVIDGFMIQTGGYFPSGGSLKEKEAETIMGEFKRNGVKNNIEHLVGTISMARTSDKNSASSQFFLCSVDCPFLDGDYAAFGRTTDIESDDVIIKISKVKTGYRFGMDDFPNDFIKIKRINLSNTKF